VRSLERYARPDPEAVAATLPRRTQLVTDSDSMTYLRRRLIARSLLGALRLEFAKADLTNPSRAEA